MAKPEPLKKPPYPLESVDRALRLLQLLRDTGSLRLTQAAEELGVSPSSAHRLLAMLVYRGFAVQDEDRAYVPGSALGEGPAGQRRARELREAAAPYLEWAANQTGESANLSIRAGTSMRLLSTVESTKALRIGDRRGVVVPAAQASGGKAILALLSEKALEQLYGKDLGSEQEIAEYADLRKELATVREAGYAVSREGTEAGLYAVGAAVRDSRGNALASISVAMPVTRVEKNSRELLARVVVQACREFEAELRAFPLD